MKCDICLSKRAYYNLIGLKAKRCGDCKEIDMINVVSKRCSCVESKLPSFNYKGLKPKYCINCKLDGMVNTSNKKCEVCKIKRASFSEYGKDTCSLCKDCSKKKNKEVYNIIVKKCNHIECKKPARYNYRNTSSRKAIYCKEHALAGMIDIRSLVDMCILCESVKATFSKDDGKATHCRTCVDSLDDRDLYKDVKNKKCSNCFTIRENPLYKPYCGTCYRISLKTM